MIRKRVYENRVEVLQGTLDMLILKTLQWCPQHGYGIVQALRANSGQLLQIETVPTRSSDDPGRISLQHADVSSLPRPCVQPVRPTRRRSLGWDFYKKSRFLPHDSSPAASEATAM